MDRITTQLKSIKREHSSKLIPLTYPIKSSCAWYFKNLSSISVERKHLFFKDKRESTTAIRNLGWIFLRKSHKLALSNIHEDKVQNSNNQMRQPDMMQDTLSIIINLWAPIRQSDTNEAVYGTTTSLHAKSTSTYPGKILWTTLINKTHMQLGQEIGKLTAQSGVRWQACTHAYTDFIESIMYKKRKSFGRILVAWSLNRQPIGIKESYTFTNTPTWDDSRHRRVQDTISRANQSRLGYEKYTTRKEGTANKIVTKQYNARTRVLNGST